MKNKSANIKKILSTVATVGVSATTSAGIVLIMNSQNNTNPDVDKSDQQNLNSVTWDNQYNLGINEWDDFSKFVQNPSEQNIRTELNKQYPAAFPDINDFDLTINVATKSAIITAKSYSIIYSGTTKVIWDTEQKITLPSNVLLSSFYIDGQIYENKDITDKMVFDKLVKEYSNSINVNQILLTAKNSTYTEFYIEPKSNSTVYNEGVLTATVNVSQTLVLSYGKTIITQGTNSGSPTLKYKGTSVTAQSYSITSAVEAPLSFSTTTGVLSFAAKKEFDGGIYIITATYKDSSNNTYTASWSMFVQKYELIDGDFNIFGLRISPTDNNYGVVLSDIILPNYTSFKLTFNSNNGIEYMWGRRNSGAGYSRGYAYYVGTKMAVKGFIDRTKIGLSEGYSPAIFIPTKTGDDCVLEVAIPYTCFTSSAVTKGVNLIQKDDVYVVSASA